PALAFGDDLITELGGGQFVAPLPECAFGELLNVALVHQRDHAPLVLQRMPDGHAHQTLGAGDGNRLNADPGILPHLFSARLQHFVVNEADDLLCFRRALLPFDADVHILGILTEDDHVHLLRMKDGRRRSVPLHRTHTGIEIENLPQGDIERANAAAYGRGQRTLDADAQAADGVHGVIRQPGLEFRHRLLAGEYLVPDDPTVAPVGLLHCRIEHAYRGSPDIAAGSITLDIRNDGIVRNDVPATGVR